MELNTEAYMCWKKIIELKKLIFCQNVYLSLEPTYNDHRKRYNEKFNLINDHHECSLLRQFTDDIFQFKTEAVYLLSVLKCFKKNCLKRSFSTHPRFNIYKLFYIKKCKEIKLLTNVTEERFQKLKEDLM